MFEKNPDQPDTTQENLLKKREKTLGLVSSSSIPALPPTVRTVLALCGSVNSDAATIRQVIQYDFGMTLNLLKAINSAFYSADKTPVSSVLHALVLLGMDVVARIVLEMPRANINEFQTSRSRKSQPAWMFLSAQKVFGAHVAIGVARYTDFDQDDVFYCTIFRDLGELVLSFVDPGGYGDYMAKKRMRKDKTNLSRQMFGLSFHELTLLLVKKWNLPRRLIDCVNLEKRGGPSRGEKRRTVEHLAHLVNEWCWHISSQGLKALRSQEECRKQLLEIFALSEKMLNRIIRDELDALRKHCFLYHEALKQGGFLDNILL